MVWPSLLLSMALDSGQSLAKMTISSALPNDSVKKLHANYACYKPESLSDLHPIERIKIL